VSGLVAAIGAGLVGTLESLASSVVLPLLWFDRPRLSVLLLGPAVPLWVLSSHWVLLRLACFLGSSLLSLPGCLRGSASLDGSLVLLVG
jgi:hypothetical protein